MSIGFLPNSQFCVNRAKTQNLGVIQQDSGDLVVGQSLHEQRCPVKQRPVGIWGSGFPYFEENKRLFCAVLCQFLQSGDFSVDQPCGMKRPLAVKVLWLFISATYGRKLRSIPRSLVT